jgi:hypothetical protein
MDSNSTLQFDGRLKRVEDVFRQILFSDIESKLYIFYHLKLFL